jgi:hypothetical protein
MSASRSQTPATTAASAQDESLPSVLVALAANTTSHQRRRGAAPPATLNWKYEPPAPVTLERYTGERFTPEAVVGDLPDPPSGRPHPREPPTGRYHGKVRLTSEGWKFDYWAPIVDQPIETAGCYANSKNP